MNTIDIVIPTMWCDENFIEYLEKYSSYTNVNQIYLIDNQKQKRPNTEILNHSKIKIVCHSKNIYVNPAWNEGYYHSSADMICLLNDDVFSVSLFINSVIAAKSFGVKSLLLS